jgi:recombinational DNA repair ATPase RecF
MSGRLADRVETRHKLLGPQLYIKELDIYDFRCFKKAVLELQYPGRKAQPVSEIPNINLLLGNNGGGKSSILRALAIAALAPILKDSGFVAYHLVRRPSAKVALLKAKVLLDQREQHTGRFRGDMVLYPQPSLELGIGVVES